MMGNNIRGEGLRLLKEWQERRRIARKMEAASIERALASLDQEARKAYEPWFYKEGSEDIGDLGAIVSIRAFNAGWKARGEQNDE